VEDSMMDVCLALEALKKSLEAQIEMQQETNATMRALGENIRTLSQEILELREQLSQQNS
jgi:hypothetical protein